MSLLLTDKEVEVLAHAVEGTQRVMMTAVKNWNKAKNNAKKAGLTLRASDSGRDYFMVSPIHSVEYTPAIEVKIDA